jgi:hypothetical protein
LSRLERRICQVAKLLKDHRLRESEPQFPPVRYLGSKIRRARLSITVGKSERNKFPQIKFASIVSRRRFVARAKHFGLDADHWQRVPKIAVYRIELAGEVPARVFAAARSILAERHWSLVDRAQRRGQLSCSLDF